MPVEVLCALTGWLAASSHVEIALLVVTVFVLYFRPGETMGSRWKTSFLLVAWVRRSRRR